MSQMDIPAVYGPVIMGLSREGRFWTTNPREAQHRVRLQNRICGDVFDMAFDYKSRMQNPEVGGHGCSLSKASITLMLHTVEGLSWRDISQACRQAVLYFKGESQELPFDNEQFKAFQPVSSYPGRLKCVTMCWEAVQQYAQDLAEQ